MNNILVVNVNWLGDAIFSTPVFAALKKAYPLSRITCLCVPRVQEVLRHCRDIDDFIIYDEKGKDRWIWTKISLVLKLRQKQFDAAFLLHRSKTRGLLVYWAGIPKRIGFGKDKGLLTHPVIVPENSMHRSDYYLQVVESFGINVNDRSCQLSLNADEMKSIDAKLKTNGIGQSDPFIVFNTGGNWDLKRWPLPLWSQLAQRIKEDGRWKIVFSGSQKDMGDAQAIIAKSGINAANMAGQTTLGESLALFRRASAVVSADSGPLHLAGSVGAATVGIFGPTRTETTGPRGTGHCAILFKDVGCNKSACYHLSCSNNVCMQSTGAEDVWKALTKVIR